MVCNFQLEPAGQLGRVRNFGLEGTTAAMPTFGRILDLEMHHPITRKVGRQQNHRTFARHLLYVPYFFWGPWLKKRV